MADFFKEVDSIGIVETSTERLFSLEEAASERIIGTYKAVRRDLQKRLREWSRGYLKERFTAQRLRGALLQVEEAIRQWEGPLRSAIIDDAGRASVFSIESLEDEIRAFEEHFTGAVIPINLDALRIATERQNYLIEQYSASFLNWDRQTRLQIEQGLTEGIATQITHEEMIKGLLSRFSGYEWQLRRIVRTEMHSIYNVSKIRGMQEARGNYLPDLMKALYHPMDHRTAEDSKLLAKMNPIVGINEPFRYVYQPAGSRKEYYREFMAPPDRPNDRAVLIPFRDAWG